MTSQPKTPRTPTAPPEQRGGTYERDDRTTALLLYRTDTIHDLTQKVTRMGSAAENEIRLPGAYVSALHCRLEQRTRGLIVTDVGSHNGTFTETKRDTGVALRPVFDGKPAPAAGFRLVPGMTFVVGAMPYRFVALDDTTRALYAEVAAVVGSEDEVRTSAAVRGVPELVSPSDLILAADGTGHLLITGEPGCEQEALALMVHDISKRRRRPVEHLRELPRERAAQTEILTRNTKSTIIVHLEESGSALDPVFVSSLFSSSYQLRVLVVARTVEAAYAALGEPYVHAMARVGLRPLARRRAAIHGLLDRYLAKHGSPLRVADLTTDNASALRGHPWRGNLIELEEVALRLDSIVRSRFNLNQAREPLGIKRNTFYHWYAETMGLTRPLVVEGREPALLAAIAAQGRPVSG